MSAAEAPVPALGVGAIVGDTFAVFFRRIGWFTLLGFVPLIVIYSLSFVLFGAVAFDPVVGQSAIGGGSAAILALLLQSIGFTLTTAFVVQAAYDTKLGRPVRLGRYIAGALSRIVPLLACAVVVLVGIYIGMLLLFVPGLWLMAVWSVVVPVIVIERAGIDALGRSANLTLGYRWPIVGALFILGICVTILSFVLSFVISFAVSFLTGSGPGEALALVVQTVGSAAGFGLFYVGTALIYARLREIKDGTGVEALAEVFA